MTTPIRSDDHVLRLPDNELCTDGPVVIRSMYRTQQQDDWGIGALRLREAWDRFGVSGNGIRVAVLDTGVSQSHDDLSVAEGKDFTGSPRGWDDVQSHGSHCAGIICARNNGLGVVGAAPGASLLAGKVLGDNGSGSFSGIAEGINWAVDRGADVISMSLGGDGNIANVMRMAIDRAISAGVIVVVAAGNSGPYSNTVGAPGNYTRCITVAATDHNSQVADFSSRGGQLDVAAPGVRILSCVPGNGYAAKSGTSMATPYVAGVSALLLERARRYGGNMNQTAIEDCLRKTARDISTPGFDQNSGAGLIDPNAALAFVARKFPEPPPPPPPAPTPSPTPAPPAPTPSPEPAPGPRQISGTFVGILNGDQLSITLTGVNL